MNHLCILISIIIGYGLFGGSINYFRLNTEFKDSKFALFKSLLTGLGASALVPLFLKMISSDLLTTSQNDQLDYFVIGGFCLISAIFSSKFIDSIGEKVLNQIDQVSKEVKDVRNELEDVTTEDDLTQLPEVKDEYEKLDYDEKDVLTKIYSSKYTFRSISGLASETFLSKDQVKTVLATLEVKNLVKKVTRNNNSVKWKLTEKGREIVAESYGDESSS
jgi:DNA-binding MarR family transcriptional regulator